MTLSIFFATAVLSFIGLLALGWQNRKDKTFLAQAIDRALSRLTAWGVKISGLSRAACTRSYLMLLKPFADFLTFSRSIFARIERRFSAHRGRLTSGAVSFYLAEVKEYTDSLRKARN